MLYNSGLSSYGFTYDNWGANPSATPGTAITPGTGNAKGSWVQLASAANISTDCYWLYLQAHTGAVSSAAKNQSLDLGVDPAGGTAYVVALADVLIGSAPALTVPGECTYIFPMYIKSGSSIGARVQGSHATAGTVYAVAKLFGKPDYPDAIPTGTFAETIGFTASTTLGTAVTPGNAADGAWATIGTTTKNCWWWQMGYQINNGTVTAEYTYIEIAYGDGTNKVTISKDMHVGTTGETVGLAVNTKMTWCTSFKAVPSGSTIYARARCINAPDTGYNVAVYGVGG